MKILWLVLAFIVISTPSKALLDRDTVPGAWLIFAINYDGRYKTIPIGSFETCVALLRHKNLKSNKLNIPGHVQTWTCPDGDYICI